MVTRSITTPQVRRVAPAILPPPATCEVGFGRCNFDPPMVAMAGYSVDGRVATSTTNPLCARAMCLADPKGGRAALCVVDLMSASRYLLEKVASLVAARVGITRERLLLVGTHTHTGPGHFYGCTLYDQLAQRRPGFDVEVASHLATQAARAIEAAFEAMRPAALGLAQTRVWSLTHNASLEAFAANPEAPGWRHATGCPGALSPEQAAVDPRLTVLAAVADGEVFGTLGVFAGHNTALGSAHAGYDPDWFGVACSVVSDRCGHAMLVPGAGADLNVLRDDIDQGPALARFVGAALAGRWLAIIDAAAANAKPFEVDVRFGVVDRSRQQVEARADTRLDEHVVFGSPALGGQEDGRSILYHLGLARPGARSKHFDAAHPQHPKARALGPLQDLLRQWRELDISPELPLHVLRVAGLVLATVPGEPTVMMGQRVERALRLPDELARVLGTAGDYAGYVTTPEEFVRQHYEGASTLLGRNFGRHIEARLVDIAAAPPVPAMGGTAEFRTLVRR